MEIVTLPVGPLQANCILLSDEEKNAVVVDPGGDAQRILAEIRSRGLRVQAVLLTHVHFDHMLAAGEVQAAAGAPLWVPEGDEGALADPSRSLLGWMPGQGGLSLKPDRLVKEGDVLSVGALRLTVIATPGRMIAHLQNSGIDLSHVECLILDEADRMLDMGFSDDIMKIVSYMPAERQTVMFSATLPPKIRELAKTILRNPAEINIAVSKPNDAIDQSAYVCYENQKLDIIRDMFSRPTDSKTIIFSSSKQKVKELAHTLKRMKLNVAAMHSDLEQAQREEVMLAFKNNKVNILVATDIVARGIDIEDIGLVINYDVPHDPEDYIHRIGRTARAAATGAAVTFVNEKEQGKFHRIERFIERDIRKAELPASVGEGPKYAPEESESGSGRRRKRSGSGKNDRQPGRGDKPRSERRSGRRQPRPDADGERPAATSDSTPSAAADSSAARPAATGAAQPEAGSGEAPKRRRRHRGGRRHRRPEDNSSSEQHTEPAAAQE